MMDDDKKTCLDTSGIVSPPDDLYYVLLQMAVDDVDDLTGTKTHMNVVFNQPILCKERQVHFLRSIIVIYYEKWNIMSPFSRFHNPPSLEFSRNNFH